MFIGHVAIGFATKPAAPKTSLGSLVLAAVLLDVLVWTFVVAGLEHIAVKPGITATNALEVDLQLLDHLRAPAVPGTAIRTCG